MADSLELSLAHVLVARVLDGEGGIRRAIKARSTEELRAMAAHLIQCKGGLSAFQDTLGVPRTEYGQSFWDVEVVPVISTELNRRARFQGMWGRRE